MGDRSAPRRRQRNRLGNLFHSYINCNGHAMPAALDRVVLVPNNCTAPRSGDRRATRKRNWKREVHVRDQDRTSPARGQSPGIHHEVRSSIDMRCWRVLSSLPEEPASKSMLLLLLLLPGLAARDEAAV